MDLEHQTQISYIKTQLTIEQNSITEAKNRCNILEMRLKELEKKLLDVEFENKFKELTLVDPSIEFNEWWNKWLKLYDQIYKDNKTNKYYYISDNCIKEISIINNFPLALNINNIYFHDIITYDCQKHYLYKYIENNQLDNQQMKFYIYRNNKWLLQLEVSDLLNQLNNEWLSSELSKLLQFDLSILPISSDLPISSTQFIHKIYKDEMTNKYYVTNINVSNTIANTTIDELHIINSFPHNISNLYFVKQIEHKKQLYNLCLYKTDELNAEYYIYQNNKWTVFNYTENSK